MTAILTDAMHDPKQLFEASPTDTVVDRKLKHLLGLLYDSIGAVAQGEIPGATGDVRSLDRAKRAVEELEKLHLVPADMIKDLEDGLEQMGIDLFDVDPADRHASMPFDVDLRNVHLILKDISTWYNTGKRMAESDSKSTKYDPGSTHFAVGDVVIASKSVQNMKDGVAYTITDIHERRTFAGNFVTYELLGPDGKRFWVGNLHLLARKIHVPSGGERKTEAKVIRITGKQLRTIIREELSRATTKDKVRR